MSTTHTHVLPIAVKQEISRHGFIIRWCNVIISPVYEVYRGYIVFAFSVRMFLCLSVNFFSVKDFSETT